MSEASLTLNVTVRDMASVQLLYVALRMLHDQMRVEANRRADDLESILDRFDRPMADGGENDGELVVRPVEVIHTDGTRETLDGEWQTAELIIEPCPCGRAREFVTSEADADGMHTVGWACPMHGMVEP